MTLFQFLETRGVTSRSVPEQLKLLDYVKPKKSKTEKAATSIPFDTIVIDSDGDVELKVGHVRQDRPEQEQEILYPTVREWLHRCTERMDRNQDGHDYLSLVDMFLRHDFTRLDDVARLSASAIIDLGSECNVCISKGLASRIEAYSRSDVGILKRKGRV